MAQMASRAINEQLTLVYQKLAITESLEYKLEILEQTLEKRDQELLSLEEITCKVSLIEAQLSAVNNGNVLSDNEYDQLEDGIIGGRVETEEAYFDSLANIFPDNARILDLGCGAGRFVQRLNEQHFSAEGIDSNITYDHIPNVIIGQLPEVLTCWKNNSTDIIVSFHLIEHLDLVMYRTMLSEVYRVLDNGGKIYMETPNTQSIMTMSQYYYKDPTHLMPRHPELYANILRFCGFKNVVIKNLPELDKHKFENIENIENINENLVHELNNKFQAIDDMLFAGSGNVLIIGEK